MKTVRGKCEKSEKCTVKDYLTFRGWGSKGTFNKYVTQKLAFDTPIPPFVNARTIYILMRENNICHANSGHLPPLERYVLIERSISLLRNKQRGLSYFQIFEKAKHQHFSESCRCLQKKECIYLIISEFMCLRGKKKTLKRES